ncbi:hypothetical protein ACHWQZ_G011524 [Mnemiopsis leidyi]
MERLYGKNSRGRRASTSTNSPLRPGSGSGARKTPTPTGKRSSSKSESDAVNVSSTAPLPGLNDKRREKDSCPCNQSLGCWKIDCSKCGQFWHIDCVGLTGLDDKIINSLSQYLCPLCFVSPVPTTDTTVDVCHICRNTLSLQHSNLAYQSSIASKNIEHFSQFCALLKNLDMNSLSKNMDTLSQFDSRLKHILLKENSLLGLDTEIKILSRILTDHKQQDESFKLLNSNISRLQEELLAFSHPNPLPPNALSDSSEHLLADISSKLEALQSNESSITAGLSELKHSVESLRSTERVPATSSLPSHTPNTTISPDSSFQLHPSRMHAPSEMPIPPTPHKQMHTSDIQLDFIEQADAEELTRFIEGCTFESENGHSVISFGTTYRYTGSQSSDKVPPIPESLKPLLDKINNVQSEIYRAKYPDQPYLTAPPINSILINKYEGSNSYLPKHSDREATIHPESSIFTLSLGQRCVVKFTERLTGMEVTQTCPNRSLYTMSRRSQEVYDHEIERGSVLDGIRYSLTFRSISWMNKNSTSLHGDSNTRFLRFGSNKRGTFGEQMPGQKFWAPKIRDIDPVSCMGYSNVVLLCGINDIKESHIKCEKDVADCYAELKLKIKQIKLLSPSTKAVFVCQLLPTKDLTLNRKVNDFNKLLHFDLFPSCKDVEFVEGFGQFVCNRVLAPELSMHFDRLGRLDMLHLNRAGGRVLAGLIKQCIFHKFHGGVDKRRHTGRVNGRLYRKVVETRLHISGMVDGCQV